MIRLYGLLFIFLSGSLMAQPTKMNLLGHWRDPAVPGSSAYDNAFNEAWGISVNGHEYGIIGSTLGTHFIDVTDPSKPFEAFLVPGKSNGTHVIHRDYDDYKCHLYAVCDEGISSLQIIDFSNLPEKLDVVYDSDELMIRVHNIYVDINKARLYTCAENNRNGFFALGVYDISNPTKPKFLKHFNEFGDIKSNHVHDAFVRNDTAYLNCGGNGFAIMDFSDIEQPKPIFTFLPGEYPQSGYNHSGWLTPDGSTYVMADENHGSPLKVLDVKDITNTRVVSQLTTFENQNKSIPHNPLVSCDYAYVSYYYDGLQVYNIKDGTRPILEYYYPTSILPNEMSYKGSWGNYPYLPSGNIIVADMQNGMFILKGIEKLCNSVNSCEISGIDLTNNSSENIRIYPNPAVDFLTIESYNDPIYEVRILHSDLRLCSLKNIQYQENKVSMGISNLPPGIYFAACKLKYGGNIIRKFIIAK
ncbi:MAG: choice-of-anchor B family protein [Bacteroidota bacterium]|nr:choice-of-anchor B family protein [Bacteroidota bacterium]